MSSARLTGEAKNSYHLLEEDGAEFIVVYLSCSVDDEELAWASDVLAQHPERNAIIATHESGWQPMSATPGTWK